MLTVEEIAKAVLRCALGWEPNARLIGNVTAEELARLAEYVLTGKVEPLDEQLRQDRGAPYG